MSILQDIKTLDSFANTVDHNDVSHITKDCTNGILGINCCSTTSNSSSTVSMENSSLVKPKSKPSSDMNFDGIYSSQCQRIDIEFENIRYKIRKFSFPERKFISKEILHGIDGVFRSGELSAIMGPSGSGKSTLLNVLSGYRSSGVSGTLKINGEIIQTRSEKLRKLSCYIQQDDLLRPQLTVGEIMMLAVHLKLGCNISKEEKEQLVRSILMLLGLDNRFNVFTLKLSGGQRKRLSIALELISNPSVLYLDEPTSGLDSSSCSQCVNLLKKLAAQGHTIICTIHQPSALVFEMFDKLYTVVNGYCMYQGPIKELVPFLADQNLLCPTYHNPADFLLEVACGDHGSNLDKLINATQKKYQENSNLYQLDCVRRFITQIQVKENADWSKCPAYPNQFKKDYKFVNLDYINTESNKYTYDKNSSIFNGIIEQHQTTLNDDDSRMLTSNRKHLYFEDNIKPASFTRQYCLLFKRNLICARRNYFMLAARLLSHFVIAMIFGYLYRHVGVRATTVLGNYVYLYGTTLLLVYTGKMAVVLTFPLEIDILRREHFNRWYSLGPHLLSIFSFELPFQSICATIYLIISAYLTENDISDDYRIYYFIMFGIMVSLSAQAWGFFIGANLSLKLAVFLGPILAVLFSVFGFCTRYMDISPLLRWLWHISYFRAGFHGSLNAIYGMNRSSLPCPDDAMYCHFRSPKVFLNFMMISDVNMNNCIILMGCIMITMYALTTLTIWHKLHNR